jgi:hypothetical protein
MIAAFVTTQRKAIAASEANVAIMAAIAWWEIGNGSVNSQ